MQKPTDASARRSAATAALRSIMHASLLGGLLGGQRRTCAALGSCWGPARLQARRSSRVNSSRSAVLSRGLVRAALPQSAASGSPVDILMRVYEAALHSMKGTQSTIFSMLCKSFLGSICKVACFWITQ